MNTATLVKLVESLSDRVETLEKAVGIEDCVSPAKASPQIKLSPSAIKAEIKKAEQQRHLGRPYWLKYGVHYRKDGAHWKVYVDEFMKVWKTPESDRKLLKQ